MTVIQYCCKTSKEEEKEEEDMCEEIKADKRQGHIIEVFFNN